MKITKSENEKTENCSQCGRKTDAIRHLYKLDLGNSSAIICSMCMSNMVDTASSILDAEDTAMIPNIKETSYDTEASPVLRRLLNIRISGAWTKEHQKILQNLDPGKMCNSNKLIYRQILEWD